MTPKFLERQSTRREMLRNSGTEKPKSPLIARFSIPAISHFRKSSRQDPTVTVQREWFP